MNKQYTPGKLANVNDGEATEQNGGGGGGVEPPKEK